MARYGSVGYNGQVDLDSTLYVVGGILLVLVYLWHNASDAQRLPLPPGPRPLPVIGNALQVRRAAPWETFHEWTGKYGPITSLKVGSRTLIVLGTREVVKDLFIKRSIQYASRPRLVLIQDYLIRGMPAFSPYGQEYLSSHQFQRKVLNPKISRESQAIEEITAKYLLFKVSNGMDRDISEHLYHFSSNMISSLLYGSRVGTADNEESITMVRDAILKGACPQNALIDVFPILQHIPGVLSRCEKSRDKVEGAIKRALGPRIQQAIQQPGWSMVRELFTNWSGPGSASDNDFRMNVAEVDLAGRWSTAIMLSIIVVKAALHPREMEAVYAEMDRVVGSTRMPAFTDMENLPYLRAFIYESRRLRTAAPLGLFRAVVKEDEYRGFRIPENAMIVANQWALNMDPAIYPNPTSFVPERWIQNPNLPPPEEFGSGKRACPGRNIGNNSVFIAMASLVWAFRFEAEEGLDEELGIPDMVAFVPRTSKVRVIYRTTRHKAMIQEIWKSTDPDVSSILSNIGQQVGA